MILTLCGLAGNVTDNINIYYFFCVSTVIPSHAKVRKMFICFIFWSSLITSCFSARYLNVEVIQGPLYFHYFLCLELETVPSPQVNYKYFVIVM